MPPAPPADVFPERIPACDVRSTRSAPRSLPARYPISTPPQTVCRSDGATPRREQPTKPQRILRTLHGAVVVGHRRTVEYGRVGDEYRVRLFVLVGLDLVAHEIFLDALCRSNRNRGRKSRAVASSRPFIRRVISSVNIQYKIEIRKRTAAIMHDMAPYKTKTTVLFRRSLCDSDRIQTCNRLIRSQVLYSVELRSHSFAFASANIRRIFLPCKQIMKNFSKNFLQKQRRHRTPLSYCANNQVVI